MHYLMTPEDSLANLLACLSYDTSARFARNDIDSVFASVASDTEADNWWWVVQLREGSQHRRYAVIRATRCDVCGWPHSELSCETFNDISDVLNHVNTIYGQSGNMLRYQLTLDRKYDKDADGI